MSDRLFNAFNLAILIGVVLCGIFGESMWLKWIAAAVWLILSASMLIRIWYA